MTAGPSSTAPAASASRAWIGVSRSSPPNHTPARAAGSDPGAAPGSPPFAGPPPPSAAKGLAPASTDPIASTDAASMTSPFHGMMKP